MQAKVDMRDVAKFFIDYIHNDLLGIIANTHLAISDVEPEVRMSLAPCSGASCCAAPRVCIAGQVHFFGAADW